MQSEHLDQFSMEAPAPKPRSGQGSSNAQRNSKSKSARIRYIEKEVFGILLFSLGIFFLFALLTHQASDPSWNTFRTATSDRPVLKIANWTGPVGAYTSDALLQVFGLSAFLIPLGFFFAGVSLLFLQAIRVNLKRLGGFLLLLLFASAFFSLYRQEVTLFSNTYPAGGIIGEFFAQISSKLFNRLGAGILLGGAFLATFVGVTHFSIPKTASLFSGVFAGQKYFQDLFSDIVAVITEQIQSLKKSRPKKSKPSLAKLHNPQEVEEVERLAISPEFSDDLPVDNPTFEIADHEMPHEEPGRKLKTPGEGPLIVTRPKDPVSRAPKIQETLNFRKTIDYKLPPPELLFMDLEKPKPVDEWSLRMNSKILEKKLLDYGVEGKVVEIHPGPVITMYEFQPAPGVKVGKIVNLSDDLSLSMGGRSVRIVAPIPNKPVVGIEIPNTNREYVPLHEIINQESFVSDKGLTLALGKDTEGAPYMANLAKMPHLLIAGATGTGKSVAINSMICSLLMKFTPDQVRFLMVDPKMVELPMYEGIPHLLLPVITDSKKAALALKWAVNEMERRLKLLSEAGTRNIDNFNRKALTKAKGEVIEAITEISEDGEIIQTQPQENSSDLSKVILNRHGELPFIVILIDELADLMMMSGREVEESITRLAQMARAVGIHLILATQRPSVDVITGLIKANFPARISFKVSSRIDSRTVIDIMGAESLLGGGDMLFMRPDSSHLTRVHGSYVTETEVEKVVGFLKKQGQPEYEESILAFAEEEAAAAEEEDDLAGEDEELFREAVDVVVASGQASTSYVQRRLRIGYNRAARLMEIMEKRGIVGPADGAKPREILNSTYSTQ